MISLRVLGSLDLLKADGQSVHTLLAQPKRVALLTVLCMRASGNFIRRDVVASLFWPERDHEHARAALRTGLQALRRALGEVVVTRGNDEIAIAPDAISCDAVAFERACEAQQWKEALGLYHGEFLAGIHVPDASTELQRWIEEQRARYREMATNASSQLAGIAESKNKVSETLERRPFPASQSAVLRSPLSPLMLTTGDRIRRWAVAAAAVALALLLMGSAWSLSHRTNAVVPATTSSR
jgi:DNA-binding SARP family transcriptional activator